MARWIAALAAAVFVCGTAGAATLEEADAAIRGAWNKEDLFSAVLRVEAMPPTGSRRLVVRGEGNVYFQRAEGVERYRNVLRLQFPEPMKAGMAHEAVFNGETLYVFNESLGRERGMKPENALTRGIVPPGGGQLLDALTAAAELSALPEEEIEGRKAFVLQGTARTTEGEAPMFERLLAYVDQETGALLRLDIFERAQVKTATISLAEFDFSPSIDPASFEVTAEESAAIE